VVLAVRTEPSDRFGLALVRIVHGNLLPTNLFEVVDVHNRIFSLLPVAVTPRSA